MRVVIARDPGPTRDRLRQTVLALGLQCDATDCLNYPDLLPRLLKSNVDLVLLLYHNNLPEILVIIEKIYQHTKAPLFVVGPPTDPNNILKIMRTGAREYLNETRLGEELQEALNKLRQAGICAPKWGKVLSVVGAQPGVGVTTIACNVGFALATLYPNQVVLGELGESVPELALNLDLQPIHGLDSLIAAWDRLDSTLMGKALVKHTANLFVLARNPEKFESVKLSPDAMRNLVFLSRTMFAFSVLDLGHGLEPSRKPALEIADKVLVVLRLDVPSLRLTKTFLGLLQEMGIEKTKIQVIVNRYGQQQQFSWKRAQEIVGMPVVEWIPDDPGHLNKAMNRGEPLVQIAKGSSIVKRFANLAKQLNGIKK